MNSGSICGYVGGMRGGEVKTDGITGIKAPELKRAGLGTGFGEGCTAQGDTWQIGGDRMCRAFAGAWTLICYMRPSLKPQVKGFQEK